MKQIADEYAALMVEYLDGSITTKSFVVVYMSKFKQERREFPTKAYAILGDVFSFADAYTEIEALKEEHPDRYVDSEQLRKSVADAVTELRNLYN